MEFEPHLYQQYAIQRILNLPASALFLDMGMGKTVATLTAIQELLYDYFDVNKILVIAPLRVARHTWPAEVEKWGHLQHLRISTVLGSSNERMAALRQPADIYIINRENVVWLVDLYGKDWPFDMVVVDELSSFKSSKAKRFRALRKVRPFIKRIVGLTGTPSPNGLIDLWPQIYLLDQGERLGKTVTGYRSRYFYPARTSPEGVVYQWAPKPEAEEAIYSKLSDICVSMRAEDWLNMPQRIDNIAPVTLPDAVMKKYRKLEKELLLPMVDGDIVAGQAGVLANKLLQLANGAVYDEFGKVRHLHDEKLAALEDVIEAANGKPVLVFYSYRHDLARIQKRITEARVLETDQDIDDWNRGEIPVLLAHPASAGHGLNLQAGGHIVVWFGMTWSLELYQQANARIHRQGQEETAIVHHLVTKGTMDVDVMKAINSKAAGQNALLEAVKARIEEVA